MINGVQRLTGEKLHGRPVPTSKLLVVLVWEVSSLTSCRHHPARSEVFPAWQFSARLLIYTRMNVMCYELLKTSPPTTVKLILTYRKMSRIGAQLPLLKGVSRPSLEAC